MSAEATDKTYKTVDAPTNEDKLTLLDNLLGSKIKGHRQLFTPDDDFYEQPLLDMAATLLDWIGVNPGQDQLFISFSDEIQPPGLYAEVEGVHYIFIKRQHASNRYETAAILAHELMHYMLMGGCGYRLSERLENEKLTDLATIYSGLGLVVLNGFAYEGNNWAITLLLLAVGFIRYSSRSLSFGYYKPKAYAQLLGHYVQQNDIHADRYAGFILPKTRHFLSARMQLAASRSSAKSFAVQRAEKARRRQRVVMVLGCIGAIVVLGIVGSITGRSNDSTSTSNSSNPAAQRLKSVGIQADFLKSQYDDCKAKVEAERPNVDNTDQTALDAFNSEVDSCNNVRDQYNSAVDTYNTQLSNYKANH